jgi:hypothetical protein
VHAAAHARRYRHFLTRSDLLGLERHRADGSAFFSRKRDVSLQLGDKQLHEGPFVGARLVREGLKALTQSKDVGSGEDRHLPPY